MDRRDVIKSLGVAALVGTSSLPTFAAEGKPEGLVEVASSGGKITNWDEILDSPTLRKNDGSINILVWVSKQSPVVFRRCEAWGILAIAWWATDWELPKDARFYPVCDTHVQQFSVLNEDIRDFNEIEFRGNYELKFHSKVLLSLVRNGYEVFQIYQKEDEEKWLEKGWITPFPNVWKNEYKLKEGITRDHLDYSPSHLMQVQKDVRRHQAELAKLQKIARDLA